MAATCPLALTSEQLLVIMLNEFEGAGFLYSTNTLNDLHPSRIKTKLMRKYWLCGPLGEKRYAESGWQRLKDNKPMSFESTNYTIIK